MSQYLATAVEKYMSNFGSDFGDPQGAAPAEIDDLEDKLGVTFCAVHRWFLLWAGNERKGPLAGHDWSLADIERNLEVLREVIEEDELDIELSDATVCYFSHQGYVWSWYESVDGIEDPDCFTYREDDSKIDVSKLSEKIGYFINH